MAAGVMAALGLSDDDGYVVCHWCACIVFDEVAGYLITMIAVPLDLRMEAAGFALFRFFYVIQPWSIRWLDKGVRCGFEIMADDVMADDVLVGLFALGVLWGG